MNDNENILYEVEFDINQETIDTQFSLEEQEKIDVVMDFKFSPDRLSQLENDTGFITREDTTNTRIYNLGETTDIDEDGMYVWTIQHNMGKMPNVIVVDSAGTEVLPDREYPDENTVLVKSKSLFRGKAYLN